MNNLDSIELDLLKGISILSHEIFSHLSMFDLLHYILNERFLQDLSLQQINHWLEMKGVKRNDDLLGSDDDGQELKDQQERKWILTGKEEELE